MLAEDTGRAVELDLHGRAAAGRGGGRADLAAAVDALLGNVFAHTPDGTAFAVTLRPRTGGGAVLVMADEGPGLADLPAAEHPGPLTRYPGPESPVDRLGPGGPLPVGVPGAADPPAAAEQVRRGASSAGSTGLGLDIARRAAQASGGRLDLSAGAGWGLRVTLELGPPHTFTSP